MSLGGLLVVFWVLLAVAGNQEKKPFPWSKHYQTFTAPGFKARCLEWERTECGLNLRNCDDQTEYFCLLDVKKEGVPK